jgi:predicted NUDIX family phosphoesterase
MSVATERVLVVPRAEAMRGAWRGLLADERALSQTLAAVETHGRFEPRSAMEEDLSFKQIIPYLVLRDGERWFLLRRTRAGGDARLHDRQSIGVGGHLNPGDVDLPGGLAREWAEELSADFVPEFRPVGLLNDDETAVGAVHLGVVYVADAEGRAVEIRETDKLAGSFATTDEVAAAYPLLETWSQLVFDALRAPAGARRGPVDAPPAPSVLFDGGEPASASRAHIIAAPGGPSSIPADTREAKRADGKDPRRR